MQYILINISNSSFLNNAATQYKQAQSLTRMSHRMEALSAVLQNNTSNQQVVFEIEIK